MSHRRNQVDWRVVEAHLRRLDDADLAAFVAALWAARGFDTDRDGRTVSATTGGETIHIQVRDAPTNTGGQSADVLVGSRPDSREDADVIDAGDLTEHLQYAVEPSTARTLCERHLGAAPEALSAPTATRVRHTLPAWKSTVVLVVVVTVVLSASALGAHWMATDDTSGDTSSSPASDGASVTTPASVGLDRGTQDSELAVVEELSPPGVNSSGVVDPHALEAAHNGVLENESYTLTVDRFYSEVRSSEAVDVHRRVTIRVDGDEYLIESLERADDEQVKAASLYHDGSNTYLARFGEQTTYREVSSTLALDGFPHSPESLSDRLVRSQLSGARSSLVDISEEDQRLYRVRVQHRMATLHNSSVLTAHNVTATITSDGFVRQLTSEYAFVTGEVRRELTYDRVGETRVEPPAWYREQFDD